MITFREAVEADLPAIVGLLADDGLGRDCEQPGPPLPKAYGRGFGAMLAQGGVIILAVQDEVVLGCLQLNILHGVSQRGCSRAQVEAVRVSSAHRGSGIGAALMREAIGQAREAGCQLMQLTTNTARIDAKRFYERLGFTHSHAGMKLAIRPG